MAGSVRVRYVSVAAALFLLLAAVSNIKAIPAVLSEEIVVKKATLGVGLAEIAVNPVTGVGLVVHGVSDLPIEGMFVDDAGAPLLPVANSFKIPTSATKPAFGPRVAFGDGRWLVTWGSVDTAGSAFSRRARFVTHAGAGVPTLGTEYKIEDAASRGEIFKGAAVGFVPLGENFLVTYYKKGHTWVKTLNFTSGLQAVGHKVTEGADNPACPLSLSRMAVDPDTSRALIVGQRVSGRGCPARATWAQLVDGTDGDRIGSMRTLATGFVHDQVVAFSGDLFVVAWAHAGLRQIRGTVVYPDGNLGGPSLQNYVIKSGGATKSTADYKYGQLSFAYSSDPDSFLMVMKGHDMGGATSPIYMLELDSDGLLVRSYKQLFVGKRFPAPSPSVAAKEAGFVIAYKPTWKQVNAVLVN